MKATSFCASAILVLSLIPTLRQEQPEDTLVRLNTLPACSEQFILDSRFVIANQFGVNVQNLRHHNIFRIASLKAPWVPITGLRATVGGRLKKYVVETEAHPEDLEFDWNLSVVPSAAFAPFVGAGQVEGEITPALALRNNRIFPPTGDSPLTDKQICMYGPWVRDVGNKSQREIHPAEAIWWRNTPNSNLDVELMIIQDGAINRFTEFCHYDFDVDDDGVPDFQPNWRPWVEYPHFEKVEIPFTYDPRTRSFAVITIEDVRSLKIVTDRHPELGDSDDGSQHRLKTAPPPNVPVFFEETVVEVREGNDAHLGVQFSDLCRTRTGIVRGNVRVLVAIGEPDTRDPGFIVLRFKTTFDANRPAVDPG